MRMDRRTVERALEGNTGLLWIGTRVNFAGTSAEEVKKQFVFPDVTASLGYDI